MISVLVRTKSSSKFSPPKAISIMSPAPTSKIVIDVEYVRGYYDIGKIVANLGCNIFPLLFVGPFIQEEERVRNKGGGWGR